VSGVLRKSSREHLPKTNATITLMDIAGKTWLAIWHKQWKNINGDGWKDFALAHHLKEGDVCVQKVVHRVASQLKLLIHILVHDLRIFIVAFMAIKLDPNLHFCSYDKFCSTYIYLL